MKNALTLILVCTGLNLGFAQNVEVWPGDANDDGKVSSIDVLHVGLSFNNQVQSRNDSNLAWQAVIGSYFQVLQPAGLSIVYADCDGDGFINEDDLDIIDQNYKETRTGFTPDEFNRGTPSDPKLYFDALPTLVEEGEQVTLSVNVGELSNPVNNFFGMVFSIYYDKVIVKPDSVEAYLHNSSVIYSGYANPLFFSKVDTAAGRIDIAISLKANTGGTQAQNISVAGPVLYYSFIIEDNLMGIAINDWDLDLRIDDIKVLDKDLQETLIYSEPSNVAVKNTVSVEPSPTHEWAYSIYPNPANSQLNIHTEGNNPINSVRLINLRGQEVHLVNLSTPENNLSLGVTELPTGMYIVEVVSAEGTIRKRVVVQQ